MLCAFLAEAGEHNTGSFSYSFSGPYSQVEVGGRFAGVEFHGGRPLPSRISFYYPVANSIDLSTDYWQRGESRPFVLGISINGGGPHWLGKEPWECTVSPHRVRYDHELEGLAISLKYEFCLHEPALVFSAIIRNTGGTSARVKLYTHLKTTFRTCQTYAWIDSSWTQYDQSRSAIAALFDQPETGKACVIVQNAGAQPDGWTSSASELAIVDSGWSRWIESRSPLRQMLLPQDGQASSAAAFTYSATLRAGDSLVVVQIISSCKQSEHAELTARLSNTWRREIEGYESFVQSKAQMGAGIRTGNDWLDKSTRYALAILAANAHFLDGRIVPMPCPAEYNFYFTHDVLLTDLAAVNFDLERVRNDLVYVADHARDSIIPHAYYWRDDGYKTEWCTPDDWNHLWFIITTASYLRHSLDSATCRMLYPLLRKSVHEVLTQRKGDGLMYAFRPDWWDLGRNEGPRSYITILAIRAFRDFTYIGSMLGEREELPQLERIAGDMQRVLLRDLWDASRGYLMNYNGTDEDLHYYMGSLLGNVFDILPEENADRLLRTAERELVDPRIGVRNVMPPDFNLDSVKTYYRIADNEAGDPYLYANGGVWPHANAWYAMGLVKTGRIDDAFEFFRQTMTVEGIMQSPMGQPAMYEYRYSDPSSPEFGRIDKPTFLWAGGFYLNTLYRLLGLHENTWNLSLGGPLPSSIDSARFTLDFGSATKVRRFGGGDVVLVADGQKIPSSVIPLSLSGTSSWELREQNMGIPQIEYISAILHDATYDASRKLLQIEVSSFNGHATEVWVASLHSSRRASIDGKPLKETSKMTTGSGKVLTIFTFAGSPHPQRLTMQF
jgi:hypothetical protein